MAVFVVALGAVCMAMVLGLAGLERRQRGSGGYFRWAGAASSRGMGRQQEKYGVGER
jgi:hypothetical protein